MSLYRAVIDQYHENRWTLGFNLLSDLGLVREKSFPSTHGADWHLKPQRPSIFVVLINSCAVQRHVICGDVVNLLSDLGLVREKTGFPLGMVLPPVVENLSHGAVQLSMYVYIYMYLYIYTYIYI